MALNSTLYRFKIKLSDVDRGIYETIELRVPKHPSEGVPFFLTRILAYCLNVERGLEFSQGISTPDEPALYVRDLTGTMKLWIDVGNPSARRLHKAAKASEKVRVYTYRDPEILKAETKGEEIYHKEEIEIFALPPVFLTRLATFLDRDNAWEFLHTEGEVTLSTEQHSALGEIVRHGLV